MPHGIPPNDLYAQSASDSLLPSPIGFDLPSVPPLDTQPETIVQPATSTPPISEERSLLILFLATMFLSALLVFSVQPMFSKMVLPLLGGSPGVWNTAMLFFQTILLLGYIYAHLSTKLLGTRRQVWLHIGMMGMVILFLPISVASGWHPSSEEAPAFWLIGLFAVSVGLPFFAVATNAPILQHWFSHSQHSAATDPYFLYGASNSGSIIALLGYPFFIEPLLDLPEQSMVWSFAYALLVGLLIICSLHFRKHPPLEDSKLSFLDKDSQEESIAWTRRLHWLVLALIPSSLLLGVTAHITTDVASVPLLWVIPLTLYLLTFVVVFARRPWLKHSWMVRIQPVVIILLAMTFYFPNQGLYFFTLHLLVFFVTALVCHGELVARRPSAEHLTEFYLWMSLGGMLGGVCNVLLAPVVFDSVYEYPLALILACLLRPSKSLNPNFVEGKDLGFPILLMAVPGLLVWFSIHPTSFGLAGITFFLVAFGLAAYSFKDRPLRFSLGIASILIMMSQFSLSDTQILTRERSFFGVSTVQRTNNDNFNLLIHGNTTHGAEHTDPTRWREPLTYYHRSGPIGQLFNALGKARTLKQVAVVGLGSGTMICYRQPGQNWTYFEIDPVVEQLARDTRYFHYMSECAEDSKVILGDARISLMKAPDKFYDLIILDAFSSDSIPMHLISRQSLALYRIKLAPEGILIFHLSNRFLDLTEVMANLAKDAGLRIKHQRYYVNDAESRENKTSSEWVVMARMEADLTFLEEDVRWGSLVANPNAEVWTDDFSNILGVMKWP